MRNMQRWHLKSRRIDTIVAAPDQWLAWDTLRTQPLSNFGLIVEAEPNENANPVSIHTAALMFRWHRDDDARTVIRAAVAHGLPDTTVADFKTAGRAGERG